MYPIYSDLSSQINNLFASRLTNTDIKHMRLFVTIKQNNRSLLTKRIQFYEKQSTTDYLIAELRRIFRISDLTSIIVRIVPKRNNHHAHLENNIIKLRIVPGWNLTHYRLQSGLQIDIQLLSQYDQKSSHMENQTSSLTSQYCKQHNLDITSSPTIVMKKQIASIKQQENNDQEDTGVNVNKLVLDKYEDLLKNIQKGNFGRFMKQLKYPHPKLQPCENQYYHQELRAILKELGEKGWGAIHYAVYANCTQAISYLLQQNVDINMRTLDDWTPLQLALNQQNIQALQILVANPFLDPNLLTSHGFPLIMAVHTNNIEAIKLLLKLQIDINQEDSKKRSVYEFVNEKQNPEIMKLLKETHDRYSMNDRSQTFHALIRIFRGELQEERSPPLKNKELYLVINPYDRLIEIFQNKQQYPASPKQLLAITQQIQFVVLNKSTKSWYMKGQRTYFNLMNGKKKIHTFSTHFQATTKQWCSALQQSKQNIWSYSSQIHNFIRNNQVIVDKVEEEANSPTKLFKKNSLMQMFTSKAVVSEIQQNQQKDEKKKTSSSIRKSHTESIEKQKQYETKNSNPQKNEANLNSIPKGLKFSDFQIVRTLGQGAFGTVFLARDLRTSEKSDEPKLYALKCFKKKKLIMNKQIKYTIAQLTILKQLCHPYIVNLHFTFQTPNYVYLGLDYCSGKDLGFHLIDQINFSENDARIYAAQILLALEYLHGKNIIYRDLKPENIMIAEDGHIRLIDFGLSKQGSNANFVAKSFCGSPAYLSPEMLSKQGIGKQSDYYCLGAVLYQMLIGEPPYFADDIQTLYHNISHAKLAFPKNVHSDAKDLLTKLMERNPSKRLGKSNINQIKKHSFFKKIDWQGLGKKQLKAPKRPHSEIDGEEQIAQLVKIIHKDFDYIGDNYRINRFINFSFERQRPQKIN